LTHNFPVGIFDPPKSEFLSINSSLLLIPISLRAEYPDRPLRLVVPFAAGGNTDVIARPFGQRPGDRSGQRVVVENRTGAGAIVGTDAVVKAKNDGYTLLVSRKYGKRHIQNPRALPREEAAK
jgi:tripartite-type tricarboxylate transporter receptor subunit TctC